MMDAKRIEEMKRLSAEATEGTWEIDRNSDDNDFVTDIWFDGADEGHAEIHGETIASSINNAQFIAESRQFVPDIIAAYEAQAEEIAGLRKALEFYANEDIYDNPILHVDEDGALHCDHSDAELDNGKRAREALAWRNTTRK